MKCLNFDLDDRHPKDALAAIMRLVSREQAFSQTYSQLTKAAMPMTFGLSWNGVNEVSSA